MSTKDLSSVRVYGDLDTEAFFGAKGSTLPDDLEVPPAPFESVGWLGEDGIDLDLSTDVSKFKAMQGGSIIRTKVTSSEKSFKIQCLEESPLVTAMYYGHGTPTVTGDGADKVARIDIPEAIPMVERSVILFFTDNGVKKAWCCPLVQATDRGTVPHKNSDMTVYEITFEIIGDCYILTNAPAYLDGTP